MGLKGFIRYRLRDIHHFLVNLKYRFLGSDVITADVEQASAQFYVNSWKERWRAKSLMREQEVIETLIDYSFEGCIFWDIGANVGTHSCFLANVGSKVYSFEPVQQNLSRLVENVTLNGKRNVVVPINVALSSKQGFEYFWVKDREVGEGTHKIKSQSESVVLPVIPANTIKNIPNPHIVKIDVEGHEEQVLNGMDSRLPRCRYIVVECHLQHNVDVDRIEAKLESLGFTTSQFETGNRGELYLEGTK